MATAWLLFFDEASIDTFSNDYEYALQIKSRKYLII
jgi:hypothetical protein